MYFEGTSMDFKPKKTHLAKIVLKSCFGSLAAVIQIFSDVRVLPGSESSAEAQLEEASRANPSPISTQLEEASRLAYQ